jgi:tRNA threonylcarbamoyladenosine biosynthesis protein TsaE
MSGTRFISRNEEETLAIASILSPLFRAGDAIVLDGELGAGKTRFVQGFAAARGSADSVTSPTFSIANFYRSPACEILHVDLYRIETPEEYADLGLADYFPRVVALVEWGLKFPDHLDDYLLISFARERGSDDRRVLTLEARGTRYDALLEEIKPRLSPFLPC